MKTTKITKEWLESKGACNTSLSYVIKNNYIGLDISSFINKLMNENRFSDANWLTIKYMSKKQCVQYAILAAEQVIDIFEKKYPNDTRPRKAIQAAKNYIKGAAAYAAANAANAAAAAAAAADADADAYAAADAAADAAYAAAAAADAAYAAYAADAAADAAYAAIAAITAADAAYAANVANSIKIKRIKNGLLLINKK